MSPVKCTSCRAEVHWAVTEAGKQMPVDVDPVPDGNLVMFTREGALRCRPFTPGDVNAGFRRWRSHFATCPNAAKHRAGLKLCRCGVVMLKCAACLKHYCPAPGHPLHQCAEAP